VDVLTKTVGDERFGRLSERVGDPSFTSTTRIELCFADRNLFRTVDDVASSAPSGPKRTTWKPRRAGRPRQRSICGDDRTHRALECRAWLVDAGTSGATAVAAILSVRGRGRVSRVALEDYLPVGRSSNR